MSHQINEQFSGILVTPFSLFRLRPTVLGCANIVRAIHPMIAFFEVGGSAMFTLPRFFAFAAIGAALVNRRLRYLAYAGSGTERGRCSVQ